MYIFEVLDNVFEREISHRFITLQLSIVMIIPIVLLTILSLSLSLFLFLSLCDDLLRTGLLKPEWLYRGCRQISP